MLNDSFEFFSCLLPKGGKISMLLESPDLRDIVAQHFLIYKEQPGVMQCGSYEDLRLQIQEQKIQFIISEKSFIPLLNLLQWECPSFREYVTVDCEKPTEYIEPHKGRLMSRRLWDFIAINAKDEYEGGGWVDSYSRRKYSPQEMQEFSENVLIKLRSFLTPKTKVLEIGCSSGLTMFKIAPFVGEYHATDLSKVIIENSHKIAEKKKLQHVHLYNLEANLICQINQRDYDIVIMNSVIQCFPGYNYLRNVLRQCIAIMDTKGVIFLGDVMNLDQREELISSIRSYKQKHPEANSKLDNSAETYYAKGFFWDLRAEMSEIALVEFSNKVHTIQNELTRFRYDVLLWIDKSANTLSAAKIKQQYGIDLKGMSP
jgi:fengycin family lipopeptide synthetase D